MPLKLRFLIRITFDQLAACTYLASKSETEILVLPLLSFSILLLTCKFKET